MKKNHNTNEDFISVFYIIDLIIRKKFLFILLMIVPLIFGYLYLKNMPKTYGMKFFFDIELIKYEDRARCRFNSNVNEVCIFQNYLNSLLLLTDIRDKSEVAIGNDHYVFKSENLGFLETIEKKINHANKIMTSNFLNKLYISNEKYNLNKIENERDSKLILEEVLQIPNINELNNEGEFSINIDLGNRDENKVIYNNLLIDEINNGKLFFKFSSGNLINYPKKVMP